MTPQSRFLIATAATAAALITGASLLPTRPAAAQQVGQGQFVAIGATTSGAWMIDAGKHIIVYCNVRAAAGANAEIGCAKANLP